MENEKYPYQKEWEEYKKRQKVFWLVFLCFIPFILLFRLIGNLFQSLTSSGDIGSLGFIVFGIVWTICGIRLQYWKCPQCGKAFHTKWYWNNILSSKCLHCKLPKYEGSTFYNDGLWSINR
jgi:hypothetical protein